MPVRAVLTAAIGASVRDWIRRQDCDPDAQAADELAAEILDAITPRSLELLAEHQSWSHIDGYRRTQEEATDPALRALFTAMLEQLLIALILRLDGSVAIPVEEIDQMGGYYLSMLRPEGGFIFEAKKKN